MAVRATSSETTGKPGSDLTDAGMLLSDKQNLTLHIHFARRFGS